MKEIKLTKDQFDKIYKSAEKISKAYTDEGSIPYVTIKEIISKAKLKKVNSKIVKFAKEYNRCLEVLDVELEKVSKELKGKVPLGVIKHYIGILKDNL